MWSCQACTLQNEAYALACAVCFTPRSTQQPAHKDDATREKSDVVGAGADACAGADAVAGAAAVIEQSRTGAAACPQPKLHLLSWNVAGWKTTCEQIRKFDGGLSSFFERHHIDVLCLQETKLTGRALEEESKSLGADLSGYESFWACNEGAGAQRQGLNGVATIARRGSVLRADAAPLGDPRLDDEGRCLLTDHGDFILFNVYVPNSAGGARLAFKLQWLRALRSAMQRARASGKTVMLVGDLNMKSRPADSHWSSRTISHGPLSQLAASPSEVQALAATACSVWPTLRDSLRAKEHQQFETKNNRNGQVFQRWGVYVETSSGEKVRLGTPMESEQCARSAFQIDGIGCQDDGKLTFGCGSQGADYILKSPDALSLDDLIESLKRVAGVDVGLKEQRVIADAVGEDPTPPSVQAWLKAVLKDDDMVDSFAAFHPYAKDRFTCWDQYRNNRHRNVGSRIDFILVDRNFLQKYARRGADLDAGGAKSSFAPNSWKAAGCAAVLGGLSLPSGFEGNGMPLLEEDEYFAQFRPTCSTGIVYTPPQLSDHVATSLLLEGICPHRGLGSAVKDAATKRCQPHEKIRKITDFFGKRKGAAASDAEAAALAKRPALGAA